MAKECKRLFRIRVGGYVYSTYVVQPFCDCLVWKGLHEQCTRLAQDNLERLPEYQILAPTPTGTLKIVTMVQDKTTAADVAFASAIVFCADGLGECLHLGLSVIDSEHRKRRIGSLLNSLNAAGFAIVNKSPFFCVTNVSTSPAILHTVGRYWYRPFPYFEIPPPSDFHLRVAKAFETTMRADARLNSSAQFDYGLFIFVGGNKGNEFQKPDGGEPVEQADIQAYYLGLVDNSRCDVILQVGWASPYSVLRGHIVSKLRKVRGGGINVSL